MLFAVYARVLAKAAVGRVCRRRSGLVVPFGVPPANASPGVESAGVHQDKPWEGWVSVRDDSSAMIGRHNRLRGT